MAIRCGLAAPGNPPAALGAALGYRENHAIARPPPGSLLRRACFRGAAVSGANRGAYEGYFHGDDFDNLSLVAFSLLGDLFLNVLVLRVGELSERAVGFLTYAALWKLTGLQFPCSAAPIQALHGVTAGTLWLWMRKLEIPLWPAMAATLFWAFQAAALEV